MTAVRLAENRVTHHRTDDSIEKRPFVAPARVNLLGEHTDYTGGLVLPIAIPFTTIASITIASITPASATPASTSSGGDAQYSFTSEHFEPLRSIAASDRSEAAGEWSDYPVGVLRQLQARGIAPPAFDLHLSGNVPFGAGLSSSASVEVATAYALLDHAGVSLPAEDIAVLCRAAENEYVHSPCGIMDQFVITAAKAGHALLLNTRTLAYELLPCDQGSLAGTQFVVVNSMVKHSVANGEYGVRHAEVMAGQAAVLATFPQLRDLGDASLDQLLACEAYMSPRSLLRCRHIITENARVLEAREAMLAGDPVRLGDLMLRAHVSQRDDFACSCDEIDFLVETASTLQGCFGARLTGGGFGGCTVNLVAREHTDAFVASLKASYHRRFNMDAEVYVCSAVDGAALSNLGQKRTELPGPSMMDNALLESPHRRWNPLRREWILVSPHRTQRPWQGQTEDVARSAAVAYDPGCYLCPGNTRAGGHQTPMYDGTYVFENDYAALKPGVPAVTTDGGDAGLLRASTEQGVCRVLCFDPRHDLTLATMALPAIQRVVKEWTAQCVELGARSDITYVQIFENRGAMMGASNPHPHGQIWATEHVPNEPALELLSQQEHFATHRVALLSAYLALELEQQERIVAANDTWVALVPFWAVWPFELLLLPRRSVASLEQLSETERDGLAAMLQQVTRGYDRVFDTPFPYSMGLHPAPYDDQPHPEWTLHAHFYPPLLRSATVRKFMVGFELLGSPQRDITPESAAATLRDAVHTGE